MGWCHLCCCEGWWVDAVWCHAGFKGVCLQVTDSTYVSITRPKARYLASGPQTSMCCFPPSWKKGRPRLLPALLIFGHGMCISAFLNNPKFLPTVLCPFTFQGSSVWKFRVASACQHLALWGHFLPVWQGLKWYHKIRRSAFPPFSEVWESCLSASPFSGGSWCSTLQGRVCSQACIWLCWDWTQASVSRHRLCSSLWRNVSFCLFLYCVVHLFFFLEPWICIHIHMCLYAGFFVSVICTENYDLWRGVGHTCWCSGAVLRGPCGTGVSSSLTHMKIVH